MDIQKQKTILVQILVLNKRLLKIKTFFHNAKQLTGKKSAEVTPCLAPCDVGEPIPLEFSINGTGHEYVFSLREKQNSERGDEHLAESKSLGQWQLAILQYETGQIVFKENVEDKSLSVNTSGWKAGVYIAVAIINGKSIAQKLAITK